MGGRERVYVYVYMCTGVRWFPDVPSCSHESDLQVPVSFLTKYNKFWVKSVSRFVESTAQLLKAGKSVVWIFKLIRQRLKNSFEACDSNEKIACSWIKIADYYFMLFFVNKHADYWFDTKWRIICWIVTVDFVISVSFHFCEVTECCVLLLVLVLLD